MPFYVYLVECSDGTYYCGCTQNLSTRLNEHNHSGTGAKYTRSRRPVKLVYSEEVASKSLALKREFEIKSLSRSQKEELTEIKPA
jgi:putative endonuclease